MKNTLRKIIVMTAAMVLWNHAIAQNYILDGNFGAHNGRSILTGQDITNAQFTCMALQPDGKILAGGHTFEAAPDAYRVAFICRFKANGKLDSSFGENGLFMASWTKIYDIRLAENGNIFFCGDEIFNGPGNVPVQHAIVGYTDGVNQQLTSLNIVNIGSPSSFLKLHLLPSNKVICAGKYTDGADDKAILAQYNGISLDYSFGGGDGIVKGSDGNPSGWLNGKSVFYGMDVTPGGKIVAVGAHYSPGDNTADVFYSRWNPDGSQDNTFYSNSYNIATWNYGDNEAKSYDVRLSPSGNLCIAGYRNTSVDVTGTAEWLQSDFNNSAACYVNVPYAIFHSVERHDGGMIFGGGAGDDAGTTQMVISRLKSGSDADNDFGNSGSENLFIPKMTGSSREDIMDIVVDGQKNIYAVGQSIAGGVSKPVIIKLKQDDGTGITDAYDRSPKIKIVPNPAVTSIGIGNQKQVYIDIYDMQGKHRKTASVEPGDWIDIHTLPSGIYLVKIAGEPITGRFIKL